MTFPKFNLFTFLAAGFLTQTLSAQEATDSVNDSRQNYVCLRHLEVDEHNDSLTGFNEKAKRNEYIARGFSGKELRFLINKEKRKFIEERYGKKKQVVSETAGKYNSATVNNFPCINEGFEMLTPGQYSTATSIPGWNLQNAGNVSTNGTCPTSTAGWSGGSNECWIQQTPVMGVPFIGVLPPSPLGGSMVAQLNNTLTSGGMTRLVNTFPVTSSNSLYQYAFAGAWDGAHPCCDNSFSRVDFYDCMGTWLSCLSYSVVSLSQFCATSNSFNLSGTVTWTGWQTRSVNLAPYIGQCVTVIVSTGDCIGGAHFGMMFFDAHCGAQNVANGLNPIGVSSPVSFCPGSTLATVNAPLGYVSYTWTAPAAAPSISPQQSTLSVMTITNPVANTVYTVNGTTSSGCILSHTINLVTTSVAITGIQANNTCAGGSIGSATVQGNGSGTGYNYIWTNSSNFVVSTSSVVNNLPPGQYSVNVSAIGSPGCGQASNSVIIVASPPIVTNINKYFCTNTLVVDGFTGSNFAWYSSNALIPGATASSYTVSSPVNNATIGVSYTSPQGCRDSVKVTLVAATPGTLGISSNLTVCVGAGNGQAIISLTPSAFSFPAVNSFTVLNSPGTSPTLTLFSGTQSANSFTASGLTGGGSYTVIASDGLCRYGIPFTANVPTPFNFVINTPSTGYCSPGCGTAQIQLSGGFSTTPQYSYSWSPSPFTSGNTSPTIIVCPLLSPGTQSSITLTVAVTPTSINCPLTQTVALNMAFVQTPTLTPIPVLCTSGTVYSITSTATNGTVSPVMSGLTSNGVITPSMITPGTHPFTYASSLGGCTASVNSNFTVQEPPVSVASSGTACSGQAVTLSASGAVTYTWSNFANGSVVTVSPPASLVYSVTGFNSLGCYKTVALTVSITPVPSITVSGNLSLCPGQGTTLTAQGALSHTWTNFPPGSNIGLNPLSSGIYTVSGTGTGPCIVSKTVSLIVHASPTLTILGRLAICTGETSTLSVSGANSYSWNTNDTSSIIVISPTSVQQFSVTGLSVQQCSATATVMVNVLKCTGLDERGLFSPVKIYPNPAWSELFIDVDENVKAQLFDAAGKLIWESHLHIGKNKIELGEFAEGVYLLNLSGSQGTRSYKVIKKAGAVD